MTPDGGGRLQRLLDEACAAGLFPQARAVVRAGGTVVFDAGAGGAGPGTIFDLASLTKPLGTTAAFLALWADSQVEPETAVRAVFPAAAVAGAGTTVGDLLYHRAGLPAFVPFFAEPLRESPTLLDPACPASLRAEVRRRVVARALATAPAEPSRRRAVYSDVGFIVLGELLAAVAGLPLQGLVARRVAGPLGLGLHFRPPAASGRAPAAQEPMAPTSRTRPREPAPGQEGLWPALPSAPALPGEVDDDNAWVLDGVAGHAGLFGTAGDVARFGQAVLDDLDGAGRLAPAALWRQALARDPVTPGSTRALGFDTAHPGDPAGTSSAGSQLGRTAPGAVGHLGFTGVSLWIDLARGVTVALCTNRVAHGRAEVRLRDFRPRFHDAVVAAL